MENKTSLVVAKIFKYTEIHPVLWVHKSVPETLAHCKNVFKTTFIIQSFMLSDSAFTIAFERKPLWNDPTSQMCNIYSR